MSEIFADLEQQRKIEPLQGGRSSVVDLHDWAVAIAYNALLQACHALIAAHDYRTRGEDQHHTAIEFSRRVLREHSSGFDRLDRMRRQRHRTVYRVAGRITTAEVDDVLVLAGELVPVLKKEAVRITSDRGSK